MKLIKGYPRLSDNFASNLRETFILLYEKSISSVYDFANKVGLPYEYCKECEAETPKIIDSCTNTCALCGQ